MRAASQTMEAATSAVNAEAKGTADGASKSSEDLVSLAAAVEEMTSSFTEIARQVAASAEVARQAVDRADKSHHTMQACRRRRRGSATSCI
jgi:methyl-accepting chemotaxis protein